MINAINIIQIILLIIFIMLRIALITLIERKLLGTSQARKGPNIVNLSGILQPIADAIKLLTKEIILPNNTNPVLFILTPIIALTLALFTWTIIPLNKNYSIRDLNIGIVFIFAIRSLRVYSVLLTGWSRNSKYAFIGAIRATAQMIRYEIAIGLIILTTIAIINSFNLNKILELQEKIWLLIPLFPVFTMFMISRLAETNRTPFDLTEGESELVAGFNVEYTSINFTLLFLAEYTNISLIRAIIIIIFLGGSVIFTTRTSSIFAIKIRLIIYIFIWTRTTLPRMRYDQLMYLIWKRLLPLRLRLIVITPVILLITPISQGWKNTSILNIEKCRLKSYLW
uniref:NADH-ubiquinone oxidoreductase chain 1 n=1 Tax=Lophophysema eversa TaxID=1510205 RepID=A0A068LD33_9METZ|nr:NADH dehydrogenase subunit 1 [Lophophysema eversa]